MPANNPMGYLGIGGGGGGMGGGGGDISGLLSAILGGGAGNAMFGGRNRGGVAGNRPFDLFSFLSSIGGAGGKSGNPYMMNARNTTPQGLQGPPGFSPQGLGPRNTTPQGIGRPNFGGLGQMGGGLAGAGNWLPTMPRGY